MCLYEPQARAAPGLSFSVFRISDQGSTRRKAYTYTGHYIHREKKRVHWTLRENGHWDNKYKNNFTKSFNYEQDFPGRWQKHEMSINFVFVLSSHVRVPPKTKVLLYTDRLRDEATASFFNKSCT
jgi:hypothetical protein